MPDRLLVGVLGNRNSGKSRTWNELFGRVVRRGVHPHSLQLRVGECVDAFLISGSFEERNEYAGDVLKNQDCRIVLCSMQYTWEVHDTLDYLIDNGFYLYIQWLNPGYIDTQVSAFDSLGLVNKIISARSILSMRDGQTDPSERVREMREFIYGWAKYRNLIHPC